MSTPENTPNEPGSGQPGGPVPGPGQQPPQYGQPAPQYGQQAPQYGQNLPPYGQQVPQYGQPAPQYGQPAPQYGQNLPAYGYQKPMPGQYGQPQYGGKLTPPREVLIAFWLIIAAAVVNLVNSFILAGTAHQAISAVWNDPAFQDQLRQAAQGQDISSITPDLVAGMVGTMYIVGALIAAALYLLVAFGVKAGRNWARILGTVFAVLSLVLLAFGVLGVLTFLLGAAAIVLLFLPVSSAFFKEAAARKSGYYAG
ncbi:hypothetical protein LVY72_16525 [Arthrobacter sp. I2-34]|uniref:DUF4064 domain-containing protein n=1 Tax=Arthrobacter hankyongi TaxID=2904801 RepID=A0ABS9LAL9_9MICC|nr:hypothetical protein [Arthrobacter hankyongi]MCG2623504.1 hypothetical protein [Arthrobacter hankyongi]